jgi:hypothetical protein
VWWRNMHLQGAGAGRTRPAPGAGAMPWVVRGCACALRCDCQNRASARRGLSQGRKGGQAVSNHSSRGGGWQGELCALACARAHTHAHTHSPHARTRARCNAVGRPKASSAAPGAVRRARGAGPGMEPCSPHRARSSPRKYVPGGPSVDVVTYRGVGHPAAAQRGAALRQDPPAHRKQAGHGVGWGGAGRGGRGVAQCI